MRLIAAISMQAYSKVGPTGVVTVKCRLNMYRLTNHGDGIMSNGETVLVIVRRHASASIGDHFRSMIKTLSEYILSVVDKHMAIGTFESNACCFECNDGRVYSNEKCFESTTNRVGHNVDRYDGN